MRTTQAGLQHEGGVGRCRLHREGEQPERPQHARHALEHRRQVADKDEDVGGDNEVVAFVAGGQVLDQIALVQRVVDATRSGRRQHRRRQIHAGQPRRQRPQPRSSADAKPLPATPVTSRCTYQRGGRAGDAPPRSPAR